MNGTLSKEIEKWQQDEIGLGFELASDVFGRKKECVVARISGGEPPWAHEAGTRPKGVGTPCALVAKWWAPGVFSVRDILKYSTKNHISFLVHLENFYFRGFYYKDNLENR